MINLTAMLWLLSDVVFGLRFDACAEVFGDGRQAPVEIGALLVAEAVAADGDPALDELVEFPGDLLTGRGQGQHGPVCLFAEGGDIAPAFQLGDGSGDGSLVLGTEAAELGGGQTAGILAQVVHAHDVGTLQAELGHLQGFDTLNVFIAGSDAGNKGIETLDHKKPPFLISMAVYHIEVELSTNTLHKSFEIPEVIIENHIKTRHCEDVRNGVLWFSGYGRCL